VRRSKAFAWIAMLLALVLVISACGSGSKNGGNNSSSSSSAGGSNESSASGGAQTKKDVTLRVFVTNVTPQIQELSEKFSERNPGIKVEADTSPVDQYDTLLNTKIASGDAPDVFLVYTGTKTERLVREGHLMDLSDQPWVERIMPGAKSVISIDDKIYALPSSQFVMGILYNKKIFNDLGLNVPQSWDEFLDTAQKIKDAGIIPIGLGLKDAFTGLFIPNMMAASAIYRDNPDFDAQIKAGQQTFAGSAWQQMMADYLDLDKRGLLNPGVLGTGYDQIQQMMASGEIAMMPTLTPTVKGIRAMNPEVELGMFPLPYVKQGETIWLPSNTKSVVAIYSKTKYPEEAKKYVEFLAEPENIKILMENNLSVYTDIESVSDPAVKELEQYIANGTYPFLDAVWPTTVQPALMKGVQSMFAGGSINEILEELDRQYQIGLNAQ